MIRTTRIQTRDDVINLLTATPDEFALGLACALLSARDLLSLRLVCKKFNIRCIAASGGGGAAAAEMLCIAEEAGRLWVAGYSEQERGWVPRLQRESWLGLMHEVELLRLPLVFGRAHAGLTLTEGGAAVATGSDNIWRCAASMAVMRSGRHFVQFTVVQGSSMFFGVMRPGWDVEGGLMADQLDGHCFYETASGQHLSTATLVDWEGQQTATEQGDRIGMLLDLDQGSMTVWKNDERLGVMQAEGLSGEFCWAVSMGCRGSSARLESALAPPSPTEGELVVANAWERRERLGLSPTATDAECEAAEAAEPAAAGSDDD